MAVHESPPIARSPTAIEREGSGVDGRRLILDTAARLFRTEGYAATSLRDIAGECGMKAGSLYYHFGSKDEIIGEVLRIGVERVADEVRHAIGALPADTDARTLLRTAVRAHLSALLELHDYTSANVRIFGQVPAAVRQAHIATRDAYERFWTGLLKRCAQAGDWNPGRDLGLTRLFLINALNGSLEWFTEGRSTVEQLAHELTELVLDGLNTRPAAGGRTLAVEPAVKPAVKRAVKPAVKPAVKRGRAATTATVPAAKRWAR